MLNTTKIKMIFFDAAGTLFHVRGSVGEIYARFAARYGQQVAPEFLQHAFATHFPQQPPMAFGQGLSEAERERREKQWWRVLVQSVFAGAGEFPQFEEYFVEIFDFFRTAAAWEVAADAHAALATLRQRGLRLGVISNFDARLYDVLRALELWPYFDSVHISTAVGVAKPDAAIFAAALRANQLVAAQAVHVGDSWREDVQGAQAAGLHPVWLNTSATPAAGIKQIHNLAELLADANHKGIQK
ncbi:MAG: HAD-IA family hydrolase [Blastocatellia bacterium]